MDVILPGNAIKSEGDLHRLLSEKLDFGPYYGSNLAALWDRLTTDVERPVRLIWKDADLSRAEIGNELFVKIVDMFRDVEEQDRELGRADIFTFIIE